MESARARKTKLMQGQKDEDEVVRKMSDWVPPLRSDRPVSAEMDQSEKVDSKIMTKMVITFTFFQLAVDLTQVLLVLYIHMLSAKDWINVCL